MNNKIKNIVNTVLLGGIVLVLFISCLLKPATEFSVSERRTLEQLPELSIKTLFNGEFMKNFEDYTVDQFPLRDPFRAIKNITAFYAMGKQDNNELYTYDGYIAKMLYPLNKDSVISAGTKFNAIYDKYLANSDCNVYFSIVPDKGTFLSDKSGHLTFDYNGMVETLKATVPGMTYIEIKGLLDYTDYYRTDTHWRQDRIFDVAQRLAEKMGVTLDAEYDYLTATEDFRGVYLGQIGLPIDSDELVYAVNDSLKEVETYKYDTGSPVKNEADYSMYYLDRLSAYDNYEVYLDGMTAFIQMVNPNAETDKELIIFRDSFGSAISPYFTEGYAKVTVVDIRYLHSATLPAFITYDNQDVLFLYSTLILNDSTQIKG